MTLVFCEGEIFSNKGRASLCYKKVLIKAKFNVLYTYLENIFVKMKLKRISPQNY